MDNTLRTQFLTLKQRRWSAASPEQRRQAHLDTVTLLRGALNSGLAAEFEDVGFCYWNISDQLAFERDGRALAENHRAFLRHLNGGNAPYLFWAVNDATQRFTLEADGLCELWWSAYRNAVVHNENCPLHFLRFGAHRAALTPCPARPHTPEQLGFARENFERLLADAAADAEYPFYETVYLCLISRFTAVAVGELCDAGKYWLSRLAAPTEDPFLTGQWSSFVTPFDTGKQASVGLNSVINALIYSGHIAHAAELYRAALAKGMKPNAYIEKRLTL
ncbi:MAG: hypothetical protein IJC25_07190 [Clostridia bacterium]|nr:hypothetical protein [Clostridia bacterium]